MKSLASSCWFSIVFILIFAFTGCTSKQPHGWKKTFLNIDSYSSIRTVDLNQDSVLDIVIGAGAKENYHSDSAVIALDGRNGKVLWMVSGRNQYVGSAIFKDINKDNVPDVFIGGRWAEFKAISGKDGKVLWEFLPDRTAPNPADSGWFNFTSPQFIPDQDGDGMEDILVANGGDARAWPTKKDRPAGRLVIFGSVSGKILSYATVPDGKETYMSPVCNDINRDGEPDVFFGTGGETLSGHLYRTTVKEIMQSDISKARILASAGEKGFVGPPVLADITNDGTYDIISVQAEGRILAINGATDSLIWEMRIPRTEIYNSPGVGFFTSDSIPDFFANFGRGRYPEYNMQFQALIDGSNGKILFMDSIGEFQYASPVTLDTDHDGYDEVLLNLSIKNIYIGAFAHLMLYDFHNHKRQAIADTLWSMNYTPSTPWVGDLNHDNKLEFVYSASKIFESNSYPAGMQVVMYQTNFDGSKTPAWGAYMGNKYDGVFRRK